MIHLLKGPVLRLGVSFDDHSHLIGKKGISHQNLQVSSKTLIHFPDVSARLTTTKVNEASCSGNAASLFQAEDEVLITPAELELKKEPCAPEMECRLLGAFKAAMMNIRSNQLLIFNLPFNCPPELLSAVHQEVGQIAATPMCNSINVFFDKIGNSDQPLLLVTIRGIMSNCQRIVLVTNLIREHLRKLGIHISQMYSTIRIPCAKWKDLISVFARQIAMEYEIVDTEQISPTSFLDVYLKAVGVTVNFDGKSLATIAGVDASKILETKAKMVKALPISVLISSNAVDYRLEPEAVRLLEAFYSVKIGTHFGDAMVVCTSELSAAASHGKRFFIGPKISLETYEANVAAIFEVKWLLSQPNLQSLLYAWNKMRQLWQCSQTAGPVLRLPFCLQSPRQFALIERQGGQAPIAGLQKSAAVTLPCYTATKSQRRQVLLPKIDVSIPPPGMSCVFHGVAPAAAAMRQPSPDTSDPTLATGNSMNWSSDEDLALFCGSYSPLSSRSRNNSTNEAAIAGCKSQESIHAAAGRVFCRNRRSMEASTRHSEE